MNLIPELLDHVVSYLALPDLSRLQRCSKSLAVALEPTLYAAKDQALRWSCVHGSVAVACRALSYGADPSRVGVLSLFLAAKHKQLEVFKLLLGAGARMDDGPQVRKIMRWVSYEPELQMILDTRMDQIQRIHCPAVRWPLVPAIKGRAPISTIRQLCDHADLNQMIRRHGTWDSPLSVAIANRNVEVAELLIQKGASVHGRDVPSKTPNVPIFAAARVNLISLCLDYGADINQRAVQIGDNRRHWGNEDMVYYGSSQCVCYFVTPLFAYLESRPDRPGIDLLLNKGAELKPSGAPSIPGFLCVQAPSTIEHLLNKWGVGRLADQDFTDVLVYLGELGGAASHERELLQKYQWHRKTRHVDGWRRLVAAVSRDTTLLLANLISDKAKAFHYRTEAQRLDEFFLATVETLLDLGADINAAVMPRGRTPLHHVCEYFGLLSTGPLPVRLTQAIVGRRLDLVKVLMRSGADPHRKIDGMDAIEALQTYLDRASEWARIFLVEIASILDSSRQGLD